MRDTGSVPGSGRSPEEGNGNLLQYSCLENPMDRGAWLATVHRVTKSRTQLKQLSTSHLNSGFNPKGGMIQIYPCLGISNHIILFDLYIQCYFRCHRGFRMYKHRWRSDSGYFGGKIKYPSGFETLKKIVIRNILYHGILGSSWIFQVFKKFYWSIGDLKCGIDSCGIDSCCTAKWFNR